MQDQEEAHSHNSYDLKKISVGSFAEFTFLRKDSFDSKHENVESCEGFNFDYELNRISEAYQIQNLQLLTSGNSYSSDENQMIEPNSNKELNKIHCSEDRNLVFKVINPPNYAYFLDPKSGKKNSFMQQDKQDKQDKIAFHKDFSTNGIKEHKKDRKSDLNPSLHKEEILNGFLESPDKRKSKKITQYKTPVIEKSNVFKIDDKLCFKSVLTPNKKFHKYQKVSKMQKQNNFSVSLRLDKMNLYSSEKREAEFIHKNKITTPIKKEIRKKAKNLNRNKKWGYVKEDFIYYGPNKHGVETPVPKEQFLIRIPLDVCKLHA